VIDSRTLEVPISFGTLDEIGNESWISDFQCEVDWRHGGGRGTSYERGGTGIAGGGESVKGSKERLRE